MARRRLAIDDATRNKDLSGKVYIVTGANSGVGLETTRQLVKQGGHVVLACRRPDAGEEAAATMTELKGSTEVMKMDLADLQSVRDFVKTFEAKHDRLDGLACNAGMVNMGNTPSYTKDGHETTIGVSYFGHFLLTELLLDTLKKSAPSRMAIVSSVVHAGNPKKRPTLDVNDLNWKGRKFNGLTCYGEAKLATTLYAKELGERLKDTGVTAASIHPGWARSNLGRGGSFGQRVMLGIAMPMANTFGWTDSNEEGAQTTLHVLLSDDAAEHNGAYFSQSSVLYRDKGCKDGGWPLESPNPNAHDMDTARKLVDVTSELVGIARPTA